MRSVNGRRALGANPFNIMKRLQAKMIANIAGLFPRADPALLADFDERTKECDMQCGAHALDPRSSKERKFLCGDCIFAVRRIVVLHVNPPIPDRSFDYRACFDDAGEDGPFGWGATQEEAEHDLLQRSN